MARSARTLRDKNAALLNAANEIFGLQRPWDRVKATLTDGQVREFHSFIAELWPPTTRLEDVMPAPDASLRALYLGENEPEVMLENVCRFSLYADQIILVNPFDNPNVLADKYNPIYHPGEWRQQTLRVAFHLKLIAPWIVDGLVLLLPDPGDFNWSLRKKTWELAGQRLKDWSPNRSDIDNSVMRQRARQAFLQAPRRYWERIAREQNPNLSDGDLGGLLDRVERERKNDPLLLDETLDRMPPQMMAARTGANLELGMYICQATGAFPYTNLRMRWNEILNAGRELDTTAQFWSPLTNAFQRLRFSFLDNADPSFVRSIRADGRLEGFRSYLRKLWHDVGGEPDPVKIDGLARDFSDSLTQAFNEAKAEWTAIGRDLAKWVSRAALGGAATVATGMFTPAIPSAGIVVAGVGKLLESTLKRKEFRQKVPMSVFIDLAKR